MLTELQLESLLVHLTSLEVKFTSQMHLEVQIIQLRIFQIEISQDQTLVESLSPQHYSDNRIFDDISDQFTESEQLNVSVV